MLVGVNKQRPKPSVKKKKEDKSECEETAKAGATAQTGSSHLKLSWNHSVSSSL